MRKTILIPIDFSVASLNTLKVILEKNEDAQFTIILLYAEILNDSITELLFYNSTKIIKSNMKEEFSEAIEILKNRFQKNIESIQIKLYHGLTKQAMNRFVEANKIDLIGIPINYTFKTKRKSINPISYLIKTKIQLEEVNFSQENSQSKTGNLFTLFNKSI